jgi:hypothetical protein
VLAGLSLSLPTFTEYRGREVVIEEGHRQAQLQYERAKNPHSFSGRRVEDVVA